IVWPPATDLKQAGQDQPLAVFEHEFLVGVQLALPPATPLGALKVPAHLRYQACDANLCYAPVSADVEWTLNVAKAFVDGDGSDEASRALRSIKFGSGAVPAAVVPVTGVPKAGGAGAADLSRLDQFAVAGTTGGYLGSSEFLTFIRNAENGVKE